jgi:hypothetical protein
LVRRQSSDRPNREGAEHRLVTLELEIKIQRRIVDGAVAISRLPLQPIKTVKAEPPRIFQGAHWRPAGGFFFETRNPTGPPEQIQVELMPGSSPEAGAPLSVAERWDGALAVFSRGPVPKCAAKLNYQYSGPCMKRFILSGLPSTRTHGCGIGLPDRRGLGSINV